MRLNLGCGTRHREGFVNVDRFPECRPDELVNLESLPWPWPDDCAEEVSLIHCLEHLGASTDVFLGIMRELYRICRHGAVVEIHVPHPRHDFYLGDPTHVRPITPETLSLFDRQLNDQWAATGSSAATPLARYLRVDFAITDVTTILDEPYAGMLQRGELAQEKAMRLLRERNNIATEYRIRLQVRK